jgi:hypothetical protein
MPSTVSQRIGHQLLGRSAGHGTCEPQLEVTRRIEAQCECCLGLAAWCGADASRAGWGRLGGALRIDYDRCRFLEWFGVFGFRIVQLGCLVDIFAVLVSTFFVLRGKATGNLRLLVMDRRAIEVSAESGLRSGCSDNSSPNAS